MFQELCSLLCSSTYYSGNALPKSSPQNNFIQMSIRTKNSTVTQNTGIITSRAARANKPEDPFPLYQSIAASKRPIKKLHIFHTDTILSTGQFGDALLVPPEREGIMTLDESLCEILQKESISTREQDVQE
jgi:hypothetical protein